MPVKSTKEKRNIYKDKDGVLMKGYTLSEVLDKPVEVVAKREYRWGKYEGLAVKVWTANDTFAVIEITAETPIKAFNNPNLPKLPFRAKFVQQVSENNRKYYTIRLLDESGEEIPNGNENGPLPF